MLSALLLAGFLASTPASATPAPALPPTPRFRRYGVDDGLPSSRVYTTVQDHQGFIWIGTGDGLARFDGQAFKLYRHDSREPSSLGGNDVSVLLVDADGRLWAGGGDGTGLNRLNADGQGFQHWRHDPGDPASLASDDVMSVVQTPDGHIWVGTWSGGVNRLQADGIGFDHWRHREGDPNSLVSDNVLVLHAGPSGRLWVGTAKGLDVIEPDGQVRHVTFPGLASAPVIWQISGADGRVRASTSKGLYRLADDLTATPWSDTGAIEGSVFASVRAANGDVWVATRGSLHLLSEAGSVHVFTPRPMLPGALPAQAVVDIEQDSQGGLWFSSLDQGLMYLGPDWRRFSRFTHRPEDPRSLRSVKVMALAPAGDGRLFVGGLAGQLDLLDPARNHARPVAGSQGLPDTSITSIVPGHADQLWIGTQKGLYLLADGALRKLSDPRLNTVISMMRMHAGKLLVAPVLHGVLRLDPATLSAQPIALAFAADGDAKTLGMAPVGAQLWRCSGAGLSRLNAAGTAFEPVPGVKRGQINAFDRRGEVVWMVRMDRLQMYRAGPTGLSLVREVTVDEGFPMIEMTRLFIDVGGRVWLTSRVGLWRFDPDTGIFRRYSGDSGLPSPQFTDSLVRRADGAVFAGTFFGVVGFRPAQVHDPLRRPELVLEGISVLRDGQRVALTPKGGQVNVAWDESGLRVAAQALSFVHPAHNHYRFRMHGFDAAWVDTGRRGTRAFTGLPAGRHVLEVQAAGLGGAWADLPGRIVFQVAPPPWRTPWAWALYALGALLLVALVWVMLRARLQRRMQLGLLQQQRRLAEDANEAKTRFLATMGHEIRTPMTGVLGMAELLTGTNLDPRQSEMVATIRHSGAVLLKLVNDALDMARIEAGRFELERKPLDPVAVMHEVAALEAGVAATKGIEIRIEAAAEVPARVLGDAIRLRQILLNLLSNAVKFTDEGVVTLMLDMQGDALRYRVHDNGTGMDDELKRRLFRRFEQGDSGSHSGGSGLGLAICKELSTLMGGAIAVQSTVGQGSTFVVTLPLPVCSGASPVGAGETGEAKSKRRKRIVLVEDDATVARVVAGLVRAQGHEVTHVDNALAALAELDSGPIDVFLVDLDLPGLDGFELIGMLRARPEGARWTIVVVTARSNRKDEERAREVGADAFLRKPVSGRQLRAVLEAEQDLHAP